MIRYSSPSSLISWPEYLPKRMRSPAFTSSGMRLPSSFALPLPAAMTFPCCGFSLAVSGMMMPPIFCSPSSMRWTMMRSCSGLTFMLCTPSLRKDFLVCCLPGLPLRASTRSMRLLNVHALSWQCQGVSANRFHNIDVKTGSCRLVGGREARSDSSTPDLVLRHLASEGIAMDAESLGRFREASVAPAEDLTDESFFELANGVFEL